MGEKVALESLFTAVGKTIESTTGKANLWSGAFEETRMESHCVNPILISTQNMEKGSSSRIHQKRGKGPLKSLPLKLSSLSNMVRDLMLRQYYEKEV